MESSRGGLTGVVASGCRPYSLEAAPDLPCAPAGVNHRQPILIAHGSGGRVRTARFSSSEVPTGASNTPRSTHRLHLVKALSNLTRQ